MGLAALRYAGYAADVWILATYAWLARSGRARPFHFANAFGAAPLLAAEIIAGLWQVLVLTVTFCVVGWVGVLCN